MSTHKIKTPRERLDLIRFIEKLNSDKTWIIEIKQYRKKRTPSQNRMYWMWINCIASETGNRPDDIHDYLKNRFLPKRNITLYNGETRAVAMSTTDLNTKQFTDYLNAIDADVSTEGIRLLYPDDMHWESFEEKYKNYIG